MLDVLYVSMGLSQARPNKSTLSKYLYSFSPVNVQARTEGGFVGFVRTPPLQYLWQTKLRT